MVKRKRKKPCVEAGVQTEKQENKRGPWGYDSIEGTGPVWPRKDNSEQAEEKEKSCQMRRWRLPCYKEAGNDDFFKKKKCYIKRKRTGEENLFKKKKNYTTEKSRVLLTCCTQKMRWQASPRCLYVEKNICAWLLDLRRASKPEDVHPGDRRRPQGNGSATQKQRRRNCQVRPVE